MSYYAGLDISMKETSIAIVNEVGVVVCEKICVTDPEIIAKNLNETGFKFVKIGLETGCLSFWLIDALKEFNINALCIESRQMATLIALKVNKTDRNDARWIADAMRCNLYKVVYNKSKESITIGLQMGARRTLVDTRTKLKNSVRGYLKAYGIRLGAVSHKLFSATVRDSLKNYDVLAQAAIEGLLIAYEGVCSSIEKAEEQLALIMKQDPIIQLFEGIPGVGTITALTYKAMIDDPNRFSNPRDVGAYLGLTPRQYSSGDVVKQGGISRCGCSELRFLLVECAIVMLTRTHGWTKLKAWGLKIMKKSGLKKAAGAVARKLAIIMLVMWKKQQTFVWGEKNIQQTCKATA